MSVNLENARLAWGPAPPRYIELLTKACDTTSQRDVGNRLGRSSATVSKVINRKYPGSYDEVEQLVLSVLGGDTVRCPIWSNDIPLTVCMRERRRKTLPINSAQQMYARACPHCPNNLERLED